jgi:hypothetical protein
MNPAAESWAEIFRQFAFVSALVGAAAFAFVGTLLTIPSRSRVVGWTMGLLMIAAAGMLVCVVGWAESAAAVVGVGTKAGTAEAFVVPEKFLRFHARLSLYFLPSMLFFLMGLGLSGWIRSRAMGIFSSILAVLAIASCIRIMVPFIG